MEKKGLPPPTEKNNFQKLLASVMKVIRREKTEVSPEAIAERKARETIKLFALSETQLPKRTLLTNEKNEIDLLKEPSGTIYRIRVDSKYSIANQHDQDDYSSFWLISYKDQGEMYFFQFSCKKKTGNPKEFHVAPQDLGLIDVWMEQPMKTDFKISEIDHVFPILYKMEAAVKGLDIMQFGTPAKSNQKKEAAQVQNTFGTIPGAIGA